ncbi:hypothetical protein Aperf_G00000042224 [Anoplocephala perfoliata]
MDTQNESDSEAEMIFNPCEAYLNIGKHLLFRKDYKRALVYLDKAQKIDPKKIECLLMRSTCHLYLTNNDEAIALAKSAHQITKRNPHAILLIAEGYYRKGDFEMALKFYTNGKRVRSSIEDFNSGIHKCEQAIKNNCGNDINPKLWPEMDLTGYYTHAFQPKGTPHKLHIEAKKADSEKWPEMLSPETLHKVFGKEYSELPYIHEVYRVEGKRAEFLKRIGMSHIDDLFPRIARCKTNRQIVRECANRLRAKADLWYKMDPTVKHATSL